MVSQNHKISKSGGFTFVELILVLGFALLITGVLVIAIDPQAILAKSRDAQRVKDLDELSTAIRLSILEGEVSLVSTAGCEDCTSVSGSPKSDGAGWVKFVLLEDTVGLARFLSVLPLDPLNESPYIYTFSSDEKTQTYKIVAKLESLESANRMRLDGGIDLEMYEVGTGLSSEQ